MKRCESQRTWRGENVAILDDGGNLRPLADGWPRSFALRWRRIRHIQALFGVSTHGLFQLYPGRPVLLAGIPTLARVAAWGGGFPIKVNGGSCRGDRAERGAYGGERRRLREGGPGARTLLVPVTNL